MSGQTLLLLLASVLAAFALLGSLYIIFFASRGVGAEHAGGEASQTGEPGTSFLVLIPAHNEEEGIRSTLHSLRQLEYPPSLYRVIVIADNCQDETAAVVREEGFECWVRQVPEACGKGHALRWALDRAGELAFDGAVFLDADTCPAPNFLLALDRALARGVSAAQPLYEFELSDRSGFSLLAVASKRAEDKLIWGPRQRLGLAIFLQGNGFCLRRAVLEQVPWTAYSIVEDLEYSLELMLRGVQIDYLPSARVISRLTRSATDALPQRVRWASGTLQVIIRYLPRLLLAALKQRDLRLAEASVALLLTSRMVLVYAGLLALGFSFLAAPPTGVIAVWVMVVAAALLQFAYFLCVLGTVRREGSGWRGFVFLPIYLGWLLLVQLLAALGVRRKVWTRTSR